MFAEKEEATIDGMKPHAIVIDTEGSGLFDFKKPADAEGQPRMAALTINVLDANDTRLSQHNFLIKPDGWVMHPDATAVNGLTTEYLMEHGVPVAEALHAYFQFIDMGCFVIAFNAQHDCKTMRGEARRAGIDDRFEKTRNVCVMRKANGYILKANGKKGWPSLAEARDFLGIKHDKAHTSGADADSAELIYRYLKAQGADLTPEVHYAANPPKKENTNV